MEDLFDKIFSSFETDIRRHTKSNDLSAHPINSTPCWSPDYPAVLADYQKITPGRKTKEVSSSKTWTPPPKNPEYDVSKRLYMIKCEDPENRAYGMSFDPETGTYYRCTGALHHGCATSMQRVAYMYTFQCYVEDTRENYPSLRPNCIECGEPLVQEEASGSLPSSTA